MVFLVSCVGIALTVVQGTPQEVDVSQVSAESRWPWDRRRRSTTTTSPPWYPTTTSPPWYPNGTTHNSTGSCYSSCGGKSTDCYCDDGCVTAGDCCSDVGWACGSPSPAPTPWDPLTTAPPAPWYPNGTNHNSTGSCYSRCGTVSTDCWCDSECVAVGDCCSDVGAVCGSHQTSSLRGVQARAPAQRFPQVVDAAQVSAESRWPWDRRRRSTTTTSPPWYPTTTSPPWYPNGTTHNSTGSCYSSCGGKSTDCYCDDGCVTAGDCCSDVGWACGSPSPAPTPWDPLTTAPPAPWYPNGTNHNSTGSCYSRCGTVSTDCWCDSECVAVGDCCSDVGAVCGSHQTSSLRGVQARAPAQRFPQAVVV